MAIVTLESQRKRVADAFRNDLINHAAKESGLFANMPLDTTVRRQGNSVHYSYSVITKDVVADNREMGEKAVRSQMDTKTEVVLLDIFTSATDFDRVSLTHMRTEEGILEAEYHIRSGYGAIVKKYEDYFINGAAGAGAGNDKFAGIDKIASANPATLYNADDVIDLRDSANDDDFLFLLDTVLSNLTLDNTLDSQKEILIPVALEAVFKRILRKSAQVRTDKDELGKELLYYGDAIIRTLGDNGKGAHIVEVDEETGTVPLYAVYKGLRGVHGVVSLVGDGEIIQPLKPDFAHMTQEVQTVGAEAVLAAVVKNKNAIAKIANLKVRKGTADV